MAQLYNQKKRTGMYLQARIIWLLLPVLALLLSGCFAKKTVIYIPKQLGQKGTANRVMGTQQDISASLLEHYKLWKGVKYRLGGMSQKGIDCSAFTLLTYRDLFDVQLPRTVSEQYHEGRKIPRKSLQPGDLIFFKTGLRSRHVGIYYENDTFMHASKSRGVTLSELNKPYWRKRYIMAKRY